MHRSIGLPATVFLVIVALVAGATVTHWIEQRSHEAEMRTLSLAHQLETTMLCLAAMRDVDDGAGRSFLESRLDTSILRALELAGDGARLSPGLPNLRDSVRRVGEYYSAKGATEKLKRIETLKAALAL